MITSANALLASWWPSLANHLWQSTLFAAVAGLLTLLLRKNQARWRYTLWLAASLKFLVPFALLMSLGSHLSWSKTPVAIQPGILVVEQIGGPFATSPGVAPSAPGFFTFFARYLPSLVFLAWISGCAATAMFWGLRWRRMKAAMHGLAPARTGREIELLSGLQAENPMEVVISPSAFEPGIVGIFRPILLLPAEISGRLSDAQLEAVIAHELGHVRRRDNLAAAAHMLVEALFWFHPLVWWIGARLVEERERACDEDVLMRGCEPQVYAEGILKVCKFYLESPLVCVAGVTGSNLKRRIEAIMLQRISRKLETGKKLLLAALGVAAVAAPIVAGLMNPAAGRAQSQPESASAASFGAASIKPSTAPEGRFFISTTNGTAQFTGFTLKNLIKFAFNLNDDQVSGGPDWVGTNRYDVTLTGPGGNQASFNVVKLSLQSVLRERFKLKLRNEVKQGSVYGLVVGTQGGKLDEVPAGERVRTKIALGPPGHMVVTQARISDLVQALGFQTGHVVLDQTGLKGTYNFTLDWKADNAGGPKDGPPGEHASPESIASLVSAVKDQLGLELREQTAPLPVLVIDHAEAVSGGE
jgi:uncharacterized protein (TIGR03435 family)